MNSLKQDGCTWALRIDSDGTGIQAVLKFGIAPDWRDAYTCEAAALELANTHQLPVPELLGIDLEATGDAPVALLMSWLPGSSTVPLVASAERLRDVGRVAGALHRVSLEPSPKLPIRKHHIAWTDFALWRRLANRYRAATAPRREAVVTEAMSELPGWSRRATEELMRTTESTALLDEADEQVQATVRPSEPTVFVHGDLWQGNTMWEGDRCVGIVDWETAGAGHPGVDLGSLRWDAAVLFGEWAPDHIATGWTESTGREPDSQSYWDVVTALNLPADVGGLVPSLHEAGRTDLDVQTVRDRHEAFLRDALDRLRRDSRRA